MHNYHDDNFDADDNDAQEHQDSAEQENISNEDAKDSIYGITEVRKAYRYAVARHAVFTPVFGSAWTRYHSVKRAARTTLRMLYLWRARCKELFQFGWKPFMKQDSNNKFVNWYFTRNCPPFGVKTNLSGKMLHTCTRTKLCPQCYGRDYVTKSFMRFEEAVWNGFEPRLRPERTHGMTLFGYRIARRYIMEPTSDGLQETLKNNLGDIWADRETELKMFATKTAVVLHNFEPSKTERFLHYYRSGVMLVPHFAVPRIVIERDKQDQVWQATALTKKELCRVMGLAFAYPKNLLTCSPELINGLMEKLYRQQMIFFYDAGESKKH